MAKLGNIDFNEVHTNDELLPENDYQAIIIESGAKPDDVQTAEGYVISKSGKGAYLPMTFEIIDGEFKGRQIRKYFNLESNNADAKRIARSEIKQLLLALNWDFARKPCGPDDTTEIHMIPLVIKITIQEDKRNGNLQNNIKKFMPKDGITAQPKTVSAPVTGNIPTVKPWERAKTAELVAPPAPVTAPQQSQPVQTEQNA